MRILAALLTLEKRPDGAGNLTFTGVVEFSERPL
jgi:hypothetical protein